MKILECILGVILGIIAGLAILAIFVALGGLVAWGIGSAIIYIFGLNAIWTYWDGVLIAFILLGLRFLIKYFFFILIENKK